MKSLLKSINRSLITLRGNLPKDGPNFFVVGFTRAGTTFMHHTLMQHPDIFLPQKIKELVYFNHDGRYDPDLSSYLSYFDGYSSEKRVGEITPLYIMKNAIYDKNSVLRYGCNESAIARIHRHYPDAKIIVTMRDPLKRLYSMYSKSFYQGKIETTLVEELRQELEDGGSRTNLIYNSRYDVHLEDLYRFYAKDKVHLMVFEEWTNDLNLYFNKLVSFLDLEPLPKWSPPPEENKNQASKYKKKPDVVVDKTPSAMTDDLKAKIIEQLEPTKAYISSLLGYNPPWSIYTH